MRQRRGFAMLAALWLIVAIAVVVLEFSLDSRERAQAGIEAIDRGRARAAASGALAMMQAQLEEALRMGPSNTNAAVQAITGADPWLGVDSVYSGVLTVEDVTVEVYANDLGRQLNINNLNENQLRTFFNFALRDAGTADILAQSIMDWRDVDSLPRPNGGERDQYIDDRLLVVPANAPFRELEEMLHVRGMTPDIYNVVAPYLTTRGSGRINVNTADTVVLRVLPGMNDQMLNRILAARSNGRRISNLQQLLPQQQQQQQGRGRGGGQQQQSPAQRALEEAASVTTTEVELTLIAYAGPQALPVRLRAIVQRSNNTTSISWKQW